MRIPWQGWASVQKHVIILTRTPINARSFPGVAVEMKTILKQRRLARTNVLLVSVIDY